MADTNQLWIVAETEAASAPTPTIEARRSGIDIGGSYGGSPTSSTSQATIPQRKRVALDA